MVLIVVGSKRNHTNLKQFDPFWLPLGTSYASAGFLMKLSMPAQKYNKHNLPKIAQKYSSRKQFSDSRGAAYNAALRLGILDEICSHMPNLLNKTWSREICEKVLSKYRTKTEFIRENKTMSRRIKENGWQDLYDVFDPADRNTFNFSRTRFKELCEVNNSGFGTFYIIHCYDELESFFKSGITSFSNLEKRFNQLEDLPYEYSEILVIEASPDYVWDLESYVKAETKDFRYVPDFSFNGSIKECFNMNKIENLLDLLIV